MVQEHRKTKQIVSAKRFCFKTGFLADSAYATMRIKAGLTIMKSPNAIAHTDRNTYPAVAISPEFAIDMARMSKHHAVASFSAAEKESEGL